MPQSKKPSESFCQSTELVLPNDTNTLGHMMGGRMMHLMDIVAAMSAQRFSNRVVVTASADNLAFKKQIKLGSAVTLQAKVTRSFNSSMEIQVLCFAEDLLTQEVFKSNEAYFTFVAVDQVGRPIDVPAVEPETEEERKLYDGALRRRQLRLVLAGRMKPDEATELRSIFDIEDIGDK